MDLVARFGIGEAAATRDIALYRELVPANLDYDTKLKSYVKSESFTPLFEYSPPQILAALLKGLVRISSEATSLWCGVRHPPNSTVHYCLC